MKSLRKLRTLVTTIALAVFTVAVACPAQCLEVSAPAATERCHDEDPTRHEAAADSRECCVSIAIPSTNAELPANTANTIDLAILEPRGAIVVAFHEAREHLPFATTFPPIHLRNLVLLI